MAFHTTCAYTKLERRLYNRRLRTRFWCSVRANAGSRTGIVAADSRVDGALATAIGRFLERIHNTRYLRDLWHITILLVYIVKKVNDETYVIYDSYNVRIKIRLIVNY